MKTAIEAGCTMFNSGEFYGQPERTLGLQLLSRFFEAEPTYRDRIYLSVSPLEIARTDRGSLTLCRSREPSRPNSAPTRAMLTFVRASRTLIAS